MWFTNQKCKWDISLCALMCFNGNKVGEFYSICAGKQSDQLFVTTALLNWSILFLRRLVFLTGTRQCVYLVWQSEAEERKSHKENFHSPFHSKWHWLLFDFCPHFAIEMFHFTPFFPYRILHTHIIQWGWAISSELAYDNVHRKVAWHDLLIIAPL